MSHETDFDITDELTDDVQKAQRIMAFSVSNDLLKDTPADTGEARGSWQIGIDEPPRKERSKSRRAGGAQTENNARIRKGTATVELSDLYVTSLKPYMERLENGWSDQNSHFIAAAVQKAGLEFEDVRFG